MEKVNFFKCNHCGNVITILTDGNVPVQCCGESMVGIVANVSDGAKEKHVPKVTKEGSKIIVEIGSVPHPMTIEHQICWIAVAQGNKLQVVQLKHTDVAKAEFDICDEPFTVFEYCNLHGLWAANL